jgi:hypothetical protein
VSENDVDGGLSTTSSARSDQLGPHCAQVHASDAYASVNTCKQACRALVYTTTASCKIILVDGERQMVYVPVITPTIVDCNTGTTKNEETMIAQLEKDLEDQVCMGHSSGAMSRH